MINKNDFDVRIKRMKRNQQIFLKIWFFLFGIILTMMLIFSITTSILLFNVYDAVQTDGLKYFVEQIWEGRTVK